VEELTAAQGTHPPRLHVLLEGVEDAVVCRQQRCNRAIHATHAPVMMQCQPLSKAALQRRSTHANTTGAAAVVWVTGRCTLLPAHPLPQVAQWPVDDRLRTRCRGRPASWSAAAWPAPAAAACCRAAARRTAGAPASAGWPCPASPPAPSSPASCLHTPPGAMRELATLPLFHWVRHSHLAAD
jgi:hypothetical protein